MFTRRLMTKRGEQKRKWKYLHQMVGEKEVMTVGLITKQAGSSRVMF